jgi:small subunit ribosomal protein S2
VSTSPSTKLASSEFPWWEFSTPTPTPTTSVPDPGNDDAIRSVALLTKVIADAVAEGLIERHQKPEAEGNVSAVEPLAEWERELLEQTVETPAAAEMQRKPAAAERSPQRRKLPAKKKAKKPLLRRSLLPQSPCGKEARREGRSGQEGCCQSCSCENRSGRRQKPAAKRLRCEEAAAPKAAAAKAPAAKKPAAKKHPPRPLRPRAQTRSKGETYGCVTRGHQKAA